MCVTGVFLDTIFSAAAGGLVAPNIINFNGGEFDYNTSWGIFVLHSQGNIFLNGLTIEGNGIIHHPRTGGVNWEAGTVTGLYVNSCWFEVNLGTVLRLGNFTGVAGITHTIINTQISANQSASVGIEMECGHRTGKY